MTEESDTNPGLPPPAERVVEVFLGADGWTRVAPFEIHKGDTFRYLDEPDIINLALTDSEKKHPFGVQVEDYVKIVRPHDEKQSKSTLKVLLEVMEKHSSCCMDNEEERKLVASQVLVEILRRYRLDPYL